MKNIEKKYLYLFVVCITLSVVILSATFAFFTASADNDEDVYGVTDTIQFGLHVERMTFADLEGGLIPLYDDRAMYGAVYNCLDDNGFGVCQIYKINVDIDEGDSLFIDGYITIESEKNAPMLFTRVFPVYDKVISEDGEEQNKIVNYRVDEMYNPNIIENEERLAYINKSIEDKTSLAFTSSGVCETNDTGTLNWKNDSNCLLFADEQLGGEETTSKDFYFMIWLHDTGVNQNELMGIKNAFRGSVTLVSAEGNQIKASFD